MWPCENDVYRSISMCTLDNGIHRPIDYTFPLKTLIELKEVKKILV